MNIIFAFLYVHTIVSVFQVYKKLATATKGSEINCLTIFILQPHYSITGKKYPYKQPNSLKQNTKNITITNK
ncbi:hypothetical protein GCM10025886_13220 [Tetragenococcus halophilus subsp. flandriensis]|nr:hypothetical protein GCM10025886_13220 [Tetragenococcus halophilus subsp. flandriensis]